MRVFMNSVMESTGMEFIRALYWHLPEGTKPQLVSQSLASHHRHSSFIPGQPMCDLWWIK